MHATHILHVDLNLLPILSSLLEERHVSRAAGRVHLSQPAMSRALQRLRSQLGDELLVRGPDGYSLTPRAERLQAEVDAALSQLDKVFAVETFDPATAAQSFRIAVSEYTLAAFGPALIQTVLTASPNSTVSFEPVDAHAFDKLDGGAVDLLICGRPPTDRYCSESLYTDRYVCVVAVGHPAARFTSLSLTQYLRWPHLQVDIGQPGIDHALEALGTSRRVAVTMPYHALAALFVPETELVWTLPARMAHHFADAARTRTLHAPNELGDMEFHAVWHPRVDNDPSHRWLLDVIRPLVAPTAPRRRAPAKRRSRG